MNRAQRITIVLGLIAFGLVTLFPSWVCVVKGTVVESKTHDVQYHISSPPSDRSVGSYSINAKRWAVETAFIAIVSGAVVLLFHRGKKPTDSENEGPVHD